MTGSETDERSASTDTGPGEEGTDRAGGHLQGVPDGAGCFEIWEHLSEQWASGNGGDEAGE